jgi:diguanylate cyclase (GGDEF)-like protein
VAHQLYIPHRRSILATLAFAVAAHSALPQSPGQPPLRTLTTAREVHTLSPEEARRGYPVHMRAVVTYYDYYLDTRRIALFVHDATGSIYAGAVLGTSWSGRPPLPGTLVDLTGVSSPGDFAPIVDQARITVIGNASLPAYAKPVTLSHLLTGIEDGQWVEIEGVVHAVIESRDNVILQIGMAAGIISATTVKRPGVDYQHLTDTWVHLRGNAAPIFNANRQLTGCRLFFPGLETVASESPNPADAFARPIQPVDRLLSYNPAAPLPHRVHLRGAVTLDWPGRTVCIQDSSNGLCAQTTQETPVAVGSVVDLVGFVTRGRFMPALSDAIPRAAPGSRVIPAVPVTPEQALRADYDSELVQIDGRLIGRDLSASDTTLLLAAGKFIFRVLLPSAQTDAALSAMRIGTNLRVTGICSVQVDTDGTLKGYGFTQASQFSILLRSAHDIVILNTPSWWTSGRMLLALLFTLAITAAGFVWVAVLRRRVEQQTRELRESRELYRHMAHHDALTGLPTRTLLRFDLKNSLAHAARFHKSVALLMLDLDRFKQINDSFGHDAGDHVLRIAAQRISSTIRKTDRVARMGGDEFVVLLNDLADTSHATQIAEKILAAVSEPIPLGGVVVSLSVSIGICALAGESIDLDALLKRVDAAMYHAKERGRGCFQVFSMDMASPNTAAPSHTQPAPVSGAAVAPQPALLTR